MKPKNRLIFYSMVLMAGLIFVSCGNKKDQEGTAPGEDFSVSADTGDIVITRDQFTASAMELGAPKAMVFHEIISANGNVIASPDGYALVSVMIAGRVKKPEVMPGDFVKKGQVLFELESNEIINIQQEYAEIISQLKYTRLNYERVKALSEESITSKKEYFAVENDYKITRAKAEGLEAKLELLGISPEEVEHGNISNNLPVKAPVKGYITGYEIAAGKYLEPGTTVLEIVDPASFQLHIHVFDKDLKKMHPGQTVYFYDPDSPETKYNATMLKTGKGIDPDTRTVLCIAKTDPADSEHFVNRLFVETEIVTFEKEVRALPGEAVFTENGRKFVLRLKEKSENEYHFIPVPVSVGMVMDQMVEIEDEGLQDILVKGGYNLVFGD